MNTPFNALRGPSQPLNNGDNSGTDAAIASATSRLQASKGNKLTNLDTVVTVSGPHAVAVARLLNCLMSAMNVQYRSLPRHVGVPLPIPSDAVIIVKEEAA